MQAQGVSVRDAHDALPLHGRQAVGRHEVRSDFGQGDQHKGPLHHAWMRELQLGGALAGGAMAQHVDVERAGSVAVGRSRPAAFSMACTAWSSASGESVVSTATTALT